MHPERRQCPSALSILKYRIPIELDAQCVCPNCPKCVNVQNSNITCASNINLKRLGLLRPMKVGKLMSCKTRGKQNYKQSISGKQPGINFEKLCQPLFDILREALLTSFTVHPSIAIKALTRIPVQFICTSTVSTRIVKTLVFTWDKAIFTNHCNMFPKANLAYA